MTSREAKFDFDTESLLGLKKTTVVFIFVSGYIFSSLAAFVGKLWKLNDRRERTHLACSRPLLQVNRVPWTAAAPAQCPRSTALHVATQLQPRALRWSLPRWPLRHRRDLPCKPATWLLTARRTRASALSSSAPWTDRKMPPSSVSYTMTCICQDPRRSFLKINGDFYILMSNHPKDGGCAVAFLVFAAVSISWGKMQMHNLISNQHGAPAQPA